MQEVCKKFNKCGEAFLEEKIGSLDKIQVVNEIYWIEEMQELEGEIFW